MIGVALALEGEHHVVGVELASRREVFVVCHFTPGRSLKVYSRPSSETVKLSASAGTVLVPPRSNSTSRLKIGLEDASNVVPAVNS